MGRRLIRSFLVLLFAVFGSAVAFSVHGDWSPVKYPAAELTETVAYWDQVDAERDAALTAACSADRNGSDCRDLVRDAVIAQDRLLGDFILNAGNGYAEAPIRYGEYGAENSGDPRLNAVAARERAHIVEYNSTENVLAPYEDIARSIARDQGLALIIGGGMTLAVPGGAGSKPAGGGTTKGLSSPSTFDNLMSSSNLSGRTGSTRNFDRSGGFVQANADFDALNPTNVRTINVSSGGRGRVGTLPDGRTVIVRESSQGTNGQVGPPTIEVQGGIGGGSNARFKIRY